MVLGLILRESVVNEFSLQLGLLPHRMGTAVVRPVTATFALSLLEKLQPLLCPVLIPTELPEDSGQIIRGEHTDRPQSEGLWRQMDLGWSLGSSLPACGVLDKFSYLATPQSLSCEARLMLVSIS